MRSTENKLREEYEAKNDKSPLDTEIYLVDFGDAFCQFAVHKG